MVNYMRPKIWRQAEVAFDGTALRVFAVAVGMCRIVGRILHPTRGV